MKRPKSHRIDAAGQHLLRGVLEPAGWNLNPTTGDYGVDFDVEVFHRDTSTGLFFKLQLKSSASSSYSRDRSFVAVTLAAENARYLAHEVQVPTILVHADTAGQQLYWLAPQLGGLEVSTLDKRRHVTIRIPTANNLAQTVEALLRAVVDAHMALALRLLARAPRERVVSVVPPGRAREELLRGLQDNVAALRVEEARRLTREGDPSRARPLLIGIVRDEAASVRARFDALVALELAELRLLSNAGAPDIERHKLEVAVARDLVELTEAGGPRQMRLYALLVRAAADLNMVVRQDWGLYLLWHNHRLAGDPYYLATIAAQHAALAPAFERSYRRAMRLVRFTARSRYGGPQSNALIRIVNALVPLIETLKGEDLLEGAREHRRHAFAVCQLAVELAREVGDERAQGLSASTALLLVEAEDDEIARWARGVLDALTDAEVRQDMDELVMRWGRRRAGYRFEGDPVTTDKQICQNMAAGLGIDVSSQDPLARAVHAAIEDLDPQRVLAGCEHTLVCIGQEHPFSKLMMLPTLGTKVLHCTKHRYAVESTTLDAVHGPFLEQYCKSCPDRAPRPPEWRYSDQWHQAEFHRHRKFLRRWRGEGGHAERVE